MCGYETYIKLKTLRELSGVSENLSTLEGSESSQWPRKEPRIFEPKTAVHTVRGQLERLLLNVVLI